MKHFISDFVETTSALLLVFVVGYGTQAVPGDADDARRFAVAECKLHEM